MIAVREGFPFEFNNHAIALSVKREQVNLLFRRAKRGLPTDNAERFTEDQRGILFEQILEVAFLAKTQRFKFPKFPVFPTINFHFFYSYQLSAVGCQSQEDVFAGVFPLLSENLLTGN